MLFIDPLARILLIERRWKRGQGLVLPGGWIEEGESPQQAAEREVQEELGIALRCGRLLVHDRRPEMDHYIFDGGAAPSETDIVADLDGEVAALHWLPGDEAIAAHVERGRPRLAAALDALNASDPIVMG